MKRILLSLMVISTVPVWAQDDAPAQAGTAALLEASNGKKAGVMLQKLEGGNLTFQPRKSSNNMTVPIDKIKSLKFSMNKEEFDSFRDKGAISREEIAAIFAKPNLGNAEKLGEIFKAILKNIEGMSYQGDDEGFISIVEPFMAERGQYMAIENNLDDLYIMLMESYRNIEQFAKAKQCAAVLIQSSDEAKVQKADVTLALIAIAENDIETAEKIRGELNSEAGALYLKAAIDRANGQPKEAMKIVTTIIADYANDRAWMPATELLSAYLYLDMTGTNSVITTNSVINTARQVKNIYAGSQVAGDARKLWVSLGGEAIEAEETARKAELAAAAKKAKEERAAEREAERKAKQEARAIAKAQEAAAASTNLNTTTNTESE